MDFALTEDIPRDDIADLFRDTFTVSEGQDEGRPIGRLAWDMMATTPAGDLFVHTAKDETGLAGCIMFSRLSYPQDPRTVFLLSPVAVAPDRQGQGIGTALVPLGLADLQDRAVDVAITHGDPA